MRALSRLLTLLVAGFLVSCAAPGGGGGIGRDAWGHRPGPKGFRTVVIDAGHGGSDSGARSHATGAMEKDLALDMARRVKGELPGWRVVLLRDGDYFIDLDERVGMANRHGDAVLVSLHFNHGPSHLSGPETFYWRVDSHGLATRIQRNLASAIPDEHGNRGLVRRRLRLTRNPEIPCVLVECGYLSNSAEARRIENGAYRASLARAIAAAIKEQSAHGDAGTGPLPPPINAPMSRPTDAPE
ncbi:MAG: N-acetylmuramoyl-L-alanine amidase [Verrucomicrobiales bacterium]|nr:N-acetylmuramoyl-L-alanine amidase [Verrucomicrobiales bacterium]